MNDFQTFHLAMVGLRMRRRWSQQRAAKAAQLDHSTVSRWESGDREPKRDTLDRYLTAVGASDAERILITNSLNGAVQIDARALTIVQTMNNPAVDAEHRDNLDRILDVGAGYARVAMEPAALVSH